jgi:hypothetical protein
MPELLPLRSAMPPKPEPSRSSTPVLLSAPGLGVVALVLLLLFASLVAAALFPLQLLDPYWQLRLDLRQAVASAASNADLH